MSPRERFGMRVFGGAIVRRVIDRSNTCIPEHTHDWPLLSLFVMGSYCSHTEAGQADFEGPSAVLYRAGAAHRNIVGTNGFEQIEIEFDPDWLGWEPKAAVTQWWGGGVGAAARMLVRHCATELREREFRNAVMSVLKVGADQPRARRPGWLPSIVQRLRAEQGVRVPDLAREVGRHPSWLGTAYKRAMGEGVLETAARVRVELASRLLRESDLGCAEVAIEAGFYDQSHMNRTFQRILQRTPTGVRSERSRFRQQAHGLPAADTLARPGFIAESAKGDAGSASTRAAGRFPGT